jgi:hypothetical protein
MRIFALLCLLFAPSFSSGQTISVEELKARIDQKVSGLNEYQQLLNDPDPDRARAAMQIMMESGDPELERMAREFGLFSTAPDVRRATLEAFFNGQPNVELWIDASDLDKKLHASFANQVRNNRGSITDGPKAFYNIKVGELNADQNCWVYASAPQYCFVRLSENSVSVNIFSKWQNLALDDSGVLKGQMDIPRVRGGIPASIAVIR